MKGYQNFRELSHHETEGEDYQIHFRMGRSAIAVMAPHGGGIEPGTTEIAEAVAGKEHHFYSLDGLKPRGNLALHITSRRFDEPTGLETAKKSETVLTIHGCAGGEGVIYLGGRNEALKRIIKRVLLRAHIPVAENPRFPGISPLNICNRGLSGQGVQIEIPMGKRRLMFQDLSRLKRKQTTDSFHVFVGALKEALSEYQEEADPVSREVSI
jgi:phage replication-related protein YjqB (UPF0714/DUF867 family)